MSRPVPGIYRQENMVIRHSVLVLGYTCQKCDPKIVSTVVVGWPSSGRIGVVSLSSILSSLPGPLALQPSFQLPSFS